MLNFCFTFCFPTASIAAEGQALCQIAKALSNVVISQVWNGQYYNWGGYVYVQTYPFGPYVQYQGTNVKHGYNPSKSKCQYDTTVPLYQPEWCTGYWVGVSCDAYYSITSLSLSGSSWTNTVPLPTSIASLTNLMSLQLNSLGLSGSIPNLVGLSRLTFLSLTGNLFVGSLPYFVSTVSSMSLSGPYLNNNCDLATSDPTLKSQVGGLPGLCTNDRDIIAAEGQTICAIAQALSNVQTVFTTTYVQTSPKGPANSACFYDVSKPLYQPDWCSTDYWSGIDCLNNKVTSLQIYASSFIKPSKFPTAIGNLGNLMSLTLVSAGLSGSIPNFTGLKRLTSLYLYSNMLTGVVPPFVDNVATTSGNILLNPNCNLTSSNPDLNYQLSSSTSTPGTCSDDRKSIASEGQAICKIAKAFSSVRIDQWNGITYVPKPVFSNSNGFNLRYGYNPANSTCFYDTSLPLHTPVWCNYWSGISCSNNKVTSLQIIGNSYSTSGSPGYSFTNTEKIPSEIGMLTKLQSLTLNSLGLTGSIPNFIGLSQLMSLDLSNNLLSGVVPAFVNHTVYLNNYNYYLPNNLQLNNNCNLRSSVPQIAKQLTQYDGQGSYCQSDIAVIAAEGQALCKIAQAFASVRVSVYSYASNSYVPKPVFSIYEGYGSYGSPTMSPTANPTMKSSLSSSQCYYDTSLPLHTPVWCNYWSGIGCTNNKVTSLSINGASWNYTVKIPSEIDMLTNLQYLMLNSVGLTGSIPNFMGLSQLWWLDFSNNLLTGSIPAAFINHTAYMGNNNHNNYIQLSNNCNLTSSIPWISSLLWNSQCKPNIAAIAAEGQAMCAIAQAWSNMQWSQYTGHNNTMTNVFGSFSSTSDQTLQRTGYIPGKTTCEYSEYLFSESMSGGGGWGYQPAWCSWPGVTCNNNHVNQLSIYVPTWTTTSKIPTALNALANLQYLSLSNMGLTGSIPNLLGLTALNQLNLNNNWLTGNLSLLTLASHLTVFIFSCIIPLSRLTHSLVVDIRGHSYFHQCDDHQARYGR